jgi:hypothetical protein
LFDFGKNGTRMEAFLQRFRKHLARWCVICRRSLRAAPPTNLSRTARVPFPPSRRTSSRAQPPVSYMGRIRASAST